MEAWKLLCLLLLNLVCLHCCFFDGDELDNKFPKDVCYYDLTIAASSACPRTELELQFGVNGGMFNQYRAAAATVWLVHSLAEMRTSHPASFRKLRLSLPRMYRTFGSTKSRPFGHFFDTAYTTEQFAKLNVSVFPVSEKCRHVLTIPTRTRDPQVIVSYVWEMLLQWNYYCVFLQMQQDGAFTDGTMFMLSLIGPPIVYSFGYRYLRFSNRFADLAMAVQKNVYPYNAIHLRIEKDFAAYLLFSSVNLTALESCLAGHVAEFYQRPLYIAASSTVFQYPEFKAWRANTRLRLLNKSDLILTDESFGREEWGAVEALILVNSKVFIGMKRSTLTEYVFFTRMFMKMYTRRDIFWNRKCVHLVRGMTVDLKQLNAQAKEELKQSSL